jgi:hypothetical protein
MSLKAVISADASGFFAEMKKVEGTKDKLKNGFKTLGAGVAVAGAAIAAAGAAIAGVTAKLVLIGEEANTSENRIRNIANQMGIFGAESGKVADRILGVANAQAKATGIDRMAIRMTQAKLLTFKELALSAGEIGGNFDRATKAAIDLAAAGFGSAEQNAVQLGKALQDPIKGITALARSGVTFTQQEREKVKVLAESGRMLEAQSMILAAVETQVGNTANATANSTDKIKQQIGILIEQIAKPLSSTFDTMMPKIEEFFDKFSDLAGIIGTKISTFGKTFTTAIVEAFDGDSERIKKIGLLVGDIIGSGIYQGITRSSSKFRSGLTSWMPGENKILFGKNAGKTPEQVTNEELDKIAKRDAEDFADRFRLLNVDANRDEINSMLEQQENLINNLKAMGIANPYQVSSPSGATADAMLQELKRISNLLSGYDL